MSPFHFRDCRYWGDSPAAPIGAVGIGAIILLVVYWVFRFLRMGTTSLTSPASEAGDTDEVQGTLVACAIDRICGRGCDHRSTSRDVSRKVP